MRKKALVPSILLWIVVLTFMFFNSNVYVNYIVFVCGLSVTITLYAYLEEKYYSLKKWEN